MKDKLILTEKQKELVEQFKNLLNEMKKEGIGIISEQSYDSHYSEHDLSLCFYNTSEVDYIMDIEEWWDNDIDDEDNCVTNEDTLKVYIPSNRFYINDGFDDNRKCVFVFKDEDTDTDNA